MSVQTGVLGAESRAEIVMKSVERVYALKKRDCPLRNPSEHPFLFEHRDTNISTYADLVHFSVYAGTIYAGTVCYLVMQSSLSWFRNVRWPMVALSPLLRKQTFPGAHTASLEDHTPGYLIFACSANRIHLIQTKPKARDPFTWAYLQIKAKGLCPGILGCGLIKALCRLGHHLLWAAYLFNR